MIPTIIEWKKWDALQKASYFAQLSTAAAFMASSAFAYLAWSEAAGSRREQRDFFISEKAPSLSIVSAHLTHFTFAEKNVSEFNITFTIENSGGSQAKNVFIYLDIGPLRSQSAEPVMRGAICAANSIEKGKKTTCWIPLQGIKLDSVEDIYNPLGEAGPVARPKQQKAYRFYSVQVHYDGLFDDKHHFEQSLVWDGYTLSVR